METEEETSLKNHLKWARLRVKGDGGNIPKEVKISEKGLAFFIPIWSETQTRVVTNEEKKTRDNDRWTIDDRGSNSGCNVGKNWCTHVGSLSNPTAGVGPKAHVIENVLSFEYNGLFSGQKEKAEGSGSFFKKGPTAFNEAHLLELIQSKEAVPSKLDPMLTEL